MGWKMFYKEKNGKENRQTEQKQTRNENRSEKKPEERVNIIPLGGLGEIGKNMTLLQYKDEIIIIDAGLTFPGEEMLGIDLVIPDYTYVRNNRDKIKGILLTHGHEDHIGGLPYLYKEIPGTKIYGSKLTLALVEAKLDDNDHPNLKTKEVVGREKVKLGKYFEVEFVRVTHSIADAFAMAIHTPAGVIVHTGDFKIDMTPISGIPMDFYKLAELGEKGVLLLMSDSTNADVPGYTLSEKTVGKSLKKAFDNAKGRIIVAAFASHVDRVQQIIETAHEHGRKIAIDGRSMVKVVDIASRLGYINVPEGIFVEPKHVESLREDEVVILCTGTQGEPMSALSRIARRSHKHISIREGDTVIISATPIPGNERAVYNNINSLLKSNAEVIYEKVAGLHTSGHASAEELKLMINLIKPKYFMPVHGEYKHLKRHKEIAVSLGIKEKNIMIASNGHKVEVGKSCVRIAGKVSAGITMIDGLGVGDVGNIVLRDRQNLAQDGIVIVVVTISSETGKIMAGPDLITRGFVYARESESLIREAEQLIRDGLKSCEDRNVTEWSVLKNTIKEITSTYFYEQMKRSPIILPIIMEV